MTKQLGPTFGDEVLAAGLRGKPFSWGNTDDSIYGRTNLSAADNTTLDAVIATHDPTKRLPNIIPCDVFLARWSNNEYLLLKQKQRDAVNGTGSIGPYKRFDIAIATGEINLARQSMIDFKAEMVSVGILTQARADEIFV